MSFIPNSFFRKIRNVKRFSGFFLLNKYCWHQIFESLNAPFLRFILSFTLSGRCCVRDPIAPLLTKPILNQSYLCTNSTLSVLEFVLELGQKKGLTIWQLKRLISILLKNLSWNELPPPFNPNLIPKKPYTRNMFSVYLDLEWVPMKGKKCPKSILRWGKTLFFG